MSTNVAPPEPSATTRLRSSPPRGGGLGRSVLGVVLLVLAVFIVVELLPWFAKLDARVPFAGVRPVLYFTVQANLLAAVVMALSGIALLRGRLPARALEYLRGLAVVDLTLTGIVYGLLLGGGGDLVLHAATPLLAAVWWIALPPRHPVGWFAVAAWLAHPVAWLGVVFALRAAAPDHWVPYYFLDPRQMGGWGLVAATCGGILAVFTVLALIAVLVSRRAGWRASAWRRLSLAGTDPDA